MKLPWPVAKRRTPRLSAIYLAPTAGQPMQAVTTVNAIAEIGLQSDRYASQSGFWKSIEACQVTLISEHDLQQADKRAADGLHNMLQHGGHRRNLVISGIRTHKLEDKTFRIGSAVLRFHKPRPPCGHLDQVAGKGMARALGKQSGICLNVVSNGVIKVGDTIQILAAE